MQLTSEDAVQLKFLIDVFILLLQVGRSVDRLGSHVVGCEMTKTFERGN